MPSTSSKLYLGRSDYRVALSVAYTTRLKVGGTKHCPSFLPSSKMGLNTVASTIEWKLQSRLPQN